MLDEAEKTLRHAYDVCGQKLHVVHFRLARLFEKRGDRPRTAAELEEYLKKTPDAKNAQAIRDQEIEGAPDPVFSEFRSKTEISDLRTAVKCAKSQVFGVLEPPLLWHRHCFKGPRNLVFCGWPGFEFTELPT